MGNGGGKEGNPGRSRGRQRMAGRKSVSERQRARPFAACPQFRVCRSRLCRRSGTRRSDGRLAGIRRACGRRWALLPGADAGARRSAGFERILRFAAIAFPMAQNAVDDARVGNKRDDLHSGATGAYQWVHLENFPQQARPGAACFPGDVGIVLLGAHVCRRSGAGAMGGGNGDSGPVGVGAVKALTLRVT